MKIKKLELKKEIVANLSDKESKQVRGGADSGGSTCCLVTCPFITCVDGGCIPPPTSNCYG